MPSVADRVRETTTTTGTGTISLGGAVSGFRAFSVAFASGTEVYYCITDGTNWEVGYGVVATGTPWTLARTVVLASSTGGALINFGAGTKDVFCTIPAADARYTPIAYSQFGGTISTNTTLTAADSGKWFFLVSGIVTLPTGSGYRFKFIGENPGTGGIIAGVSTGFPDGTVIGAGGTIAVVPTYAAIDLASVAGAYYVQSMSGKIIAKTLSTSGTATLGAADGGSANIGAQINGRTKLGRTSSGDLAHYIDGPGGIIVFRNSAITYDNVYFADNGDVVVARGNLTAPNLFAQGQSWQAVSRASGTLYTNSTLRPIVINIWGTNNGTGGAFYVNGVVAGVLNTTTNSFLSAVVPVGHTYQLTGGNGIIIWSELRT